MRVPVVAANWKMNKILSEAESFAAEIPINKDLYDKVEVIICPPFTSLYVVSQALKGTGIKLGAQNMYPEEMGAFTGEVSPVMLKDIGCKYVILGHSERRHILKESNEFINRKVKAAIKHELIPILCIGETLNERKKGKTEEVCINQLLGSLNGVAKEDVAKSIIAYEPVWAIGTGENASSQDAERTISFIRELIFNQFGADTAKAIRILYGGSVKPNNIGEYMENENIDGALVGGASLKIDSFYELIMNGA